MLILHTKQMQLDLHFRKEFHLERSLVWELAREDAHLEAHKAHYLSPMKSLPW